MPIRKPQSNDSKESNPSRIPRLNRKEKRAYLSTGPGNSPSVVNGPTSPVMSEQGAIELPGSEVPAAMAADTYARHESASTANGSTTANSIRTSTNGADPNLSTLEIKSPTFSNADSLFPENNGLNPNNSPVQSIPNRLNSVQSSSYSPTETGPNYTFNTGSRSRHSAFIPSSFTNLWCSSSTITPPRRTVPEPERANIPAIDRVADSRPVVPPKLSTLAPVTGPDESPQSFFDSDSDSDSERDQSPILSEAQTSSVARPALVEHKSSVRIPQRNIIGLRTAAANPGPSMSKASQVLGTDFKSLHDLTPALQRDDPLKSHPVDRYPSLLVPEMHGAAVANNYARNESVSAASTTDTHDFADGDVPSPALSFTPSSIVEGPPHDDEALDTMPSPRACLGGLHPPPTLHSQQHYQQSIDNLASAGSVKRTASAPPLRRIVRINTDDVAVEMGPGGKRFHRESVVSTPYPTRNPSLQDPTGLLSSNDIPTNDAISPGAAPSTSVAAPAHPSFFEKIAARKQDTLILRLSVTSHPLLARTIALPINPPPNTNAPPYDDHHLFSALRVEYYALIGPARLYLTARTFASISYHGPGSFSHFDALDFLEHFSDSSLGKRRRKWVLWARRLAVSRSHPHPRYPSTPQPDSAIPHRGSARQDSMWDDIELAATYPPVPPLPRLEFSHRFSIVKIALAFLATLIASVAAVVLWTLLGLPREVAGPFGPFGGSLGLGFRDSGARLQTGLVFGIMVLLFGLAWVGSWVGGSWVVL